MRRGGEERRAGKRRDLYLKIGCHKKKKVGWSERMKKNEEEEQICLLARGRRSVKGSVADTERD